MSKIYSYVLDHDYGLAPNPFGGFCTLAVCKSQIRKSGNLEIGDWVIGTGSRAIENVTNRKYIGKLIYAMQVEERMKFNEYWNDERFEYKKPIVNGALNTMYGDNIYWMSGQNEWHQLDSAHSNEDGTTNLTHLKRDISGENVLISQNYYYFGENAPFIPKELSNVCHFGIGEKLVDPKYVTPFLEWLSKGFTNGIHGDPINWINYKQLKLL